MATDQAAAESKGKAKKGLSRSTLLIVVLLVVIVAGGIYFFLGRGDSTSDGAAEKEEVHLGVVVTLEPIFINLKDDRFLKLGMALQTTHEGGGGGHGGGGPDVDGAMALDAAIEVFSDQDMQMLSTINGRSELKEELVSRIVEGYGPEITTIYFTEFVMQ
jgi:flagellar FliL protein